MTFQPVLPSGGIAGWRLLKATMPAQRASFDASARLERDTSYFEARIGSVESAAELVGDRRLLRVSLGAFGLGDDLNNRAFIERILEGGSQARDALANRLADSRYRAFAREFGFGDITGARVADPGFGARLAAQFRAREFEVAVGNQDQAMRLALNAERALPSIVGQGSEETQWLRIMGEPPLRQFFETALGLPKSFGQIDLDRQIEEFSDRAQRQLGISELSDLAAPERMSKLIDRFLVRDQITGQAAVKVGSVALTLLQSMRPVA